jgi:hypothetical protein
LCPGVERIRDHTHIIRPSEEIVCRWSVGTSPCHVLLIGRFKQVEVEHQHFLPIAAITGYRLRIQEWVERLLQEKEAVGLVSGFMFLKKDVISARAVNFEKALVKILELIQQSTVGIFSMTIDLWDEFGVRRSMRRGATADALWAEH